MKLTLQLPIPSRRLFPNARGNEFVRRQSFRGAKQYAIVEAMRVITDAGRNRGPRWDNAFYSLTVFWPDANRPDEDNLIAACKAYFDGVQVAGIVKNDKNLAIGEPVKWAVDAKMPRIEMTIRERT